MNTILKKIGVLTLLTLTATVQAKPKSVSATFNVSVTIYDKCSINKTAESQNTPYAVDCMARSPFTVQIKKPKVEPGTEQSLEDKQLQSRARVYEIFY